MLLRWWNFYKSPWIFKLGIWANFITGFAYYTGVLLSTSMIMSWPALAIAIFRCSIIDEGVCSYNGDFIYSFFTPVRVIWLLPWQLRIVSRLGLASFSNREIAAGFLAVAIFSSASVYIRSGYYLYRYYLPVRLFCGKGWRAKSSFYLIRFAIEAGLRWLPFIVSWPGDSGAPEPSALE